MKSTDPDFPTMTQLATFSIWLLCAAVGMVGAFVPTIADRPAFSAPKELTIDVSTDVPSVPNTPDIVATPRAPADRQPSLPPAAPAMAAPSPEIAFAIPAPGAVRPVPVVATPIAPPRTPAPTSAIHHLVLGQGEAQYIKLDYPEEAQLNGEEGSVGVQFTQDDAGHVTDAHLPRPSRWPLLNNAALKAVRQTAFPPGQPGTYDIPFEFKLQ